MKDRFPIIMFLVFVWVVGLITILYGLKTEPVVSILGISAPYYLTKFLLIENKEE